MARNLKRILLSVCIIRDLLKTKNDLRPEQAQSGKRDADSAPGSFSTRTKDAESVLKTGSGAEKPGPPRTIRARDYKKLEPPESKTPCYACGKKGSWYVEKFTCGATGPAQGPAGSPADLPLVLQ